MLYYSIDHPDPDNNFTVTVVPINGAGPGEDDTERFIYSIGELIFTHYSICTAVIIGPGAVHTSSVLSSTVSMSLSSTSTQYISSSFPAFPTIHTASVCEYYTVIIDCRFWSVFIIMFV